MGDFFLGVIAESIIDFFIFLIGKLIWQYLFNFIGGTFRWIVGTIYRNIAGKQKYTIVEYIEGRVNVKKANNSCTYNSFIGLFIIIIAIVVFILY